MTDFHPTLSLPTAKISDSGLVRLGSGSISPHTPELTGEAGMKETIVKKAKKAKRI